CADCGDAPGIRGDDPRAYPGAARPRGSAPLGRPLRAGPRHLSRRLLSGRLGDLCGAFGHLAVAVRDRVGGMRTPAEDDAAPAELDVRMMVLGVCQLADAVHERERLGEVREAELALQRAVDLAPAFGRVHTDQYGER